MTYRIHLTGIVQGVGFRPMVYGLAKNKQIKGTVSNSSAGVEIEFNATDELAKKFYHSILQNLPVNSQVTHHHIKVIDDHLFRNFSIIESSTHPGASVLLSPDFALCDSCRAELNAFPDRRHRYAFITCTTCGPRYSITKQLPYDRIHTTMQHFRMCKDCQQEYGNPLDRRFFSQTNSCEKCGIEMSLHFPDLTLLGAKESVHETVELIKAGKTVAVKGIGGYLLLCDATQADAIIRMRERKHRPSKPFALLYPNEAVLQEDIDLTDVERQALKSPCAPIVLGHMKRHTQSGIRSSLVAPGLHTLGVMLPYAPLLELIVSEFDFPLVATSANISNSPIVYKDEDALNSLFAVADAVLLHNRDIIIPQDDSVVRFTDNDQRIIIRRSRGMAPTYFVSSAFPSQQVLAMGAQLKSTITLSHHSNVYVSQYIGDLESADTEENYQTVTEHLLKITDAQPELILTDSHPDYASTRLGNQFSSLWGIPVVKIQHHKAHFAAVLCENNLKETEDPILGVIWDGTGLGEDGQSWGGEFFQWDGHAMERVAQMEYFPLLLGDKMAREPRLSALAVATSEEHQSSLISCFTPKEWKVFTAALKTEKGKTSSIGRLFDAVASWCGLCDKASYEGEAALLLEELASLFFTSNKDYFETYPVDYLNGEVNTLSLASQVIHDVIAGTIPSAVAARFHCTLVKLIRIVAEDKKTQSIAFSGGVFQNELLVSLIEKYLGSEFKLYFHQQLSPNDECISFGQLAYWNMLHQNKANAKATNSLMYAESEQH
ncbi:MAG: carbamoyltransferase HypF [Bacteroidota bacterium]